MKSLDLVLGRGRSLSEVAPDQPLAKAICYGVLRYLPILRELLAGYLSKPLKARDRQIELLLLVGLYQLGWMKKAPHAVLNETVRVARKLGRPWATALVNGVLRNYQRDGYPTLVDNGEAMTGHPDWLRRRIVQAWGDRAAGIFVANNQQAPMWLRVNSSRGGALSNYQDQLRAAGLNATPAPIAPQALQLEHPCDVVDLPAFSAGAVSVQDISAQLAAPLLSIKAGQRVLDACAAPGGKTAHLLELQQNLRLLAIDVDADRATRIEQTLDRLRLSATVAVADMSEPNRWHDGQLFDRILLDVPCSATGVVRRHPDIKWLRRDEDIADLCRRQRQLLDAAWSLLAPSGLLLYTTCSILPDENADQIAAFTDNQADCRLLELPESLGHNTGFGIQRLPGDDDGDGFFYALLEKSG